MICACEAIALKEICEIQREEARKKTAEMRRKKILEIWEPFLEKAIINNAKAGKEYTWLYFKKYDKGETVQELEKLQYSRYADKRGEYYPKRDAELIPFDENIIKELLTTNCYEFTIYEGDFYYYGFGSVRGYAMCIHPNPKCI